MSGGAGGGRTLLCFGDSNTHGTTALAGPLDMGRFDRATRWPGVAAAALGPGWHVIEEGHPGRTTVHADPVEGGHKSGIAALPVLLESHRPLDVVAILLGTNDLKARFSMGPADVAQALERLVACVRGSDAGPGGSAPGVLLVAPVPVGETGIFAAMFAGAAGKSRALAPLVSAAAARAGAGFLDAGLHAAVDPLDGIHLTAEGHRALGAAIAAAVAAQAGAAAS